MPPEEQPCTRCGGSGEEPGIACAIIEDCARCKGTGIEPDD